MILALGMLRVDFEILAGHPLTDHSKSKVRNTIWLSHFDLKISKGCDFWNDFWIDNVGDLLRKVQVNEKKPLF